MQLANAEVQYNDLSTQAWGHAGDYKTYYYDANGSLTYTIYSDESTSGDPATIVATHPEYKYDLNEYNLQNRLSKVTRFNPTPVETHVTEYRYNPDGIRVAKIEDGIKRTDYLIDPANHTGYAQVLEETEYDISGSTPVPTTRIQYTIGDDIISQTRSTYSGGVWSAGQTEYFLYDGHGSTRQLVNHPVPPAQPTVIDSFSYDSYGVMLGNTVNPADTASNTTRLLYCGEQYDKSLNQYYLRARYYNQANGRFTQMDSFEGSPSDPQSLHKYTYCHNDPINFVDPSGHFETMAGAVAALSIQGVLYSIIGGMTANAISGGKIAGGLAAFFSAIMSPGTWAMAANGVFDSLKDLISDVGALLKTVAIAIISQIFGFVNIAMTLWGAFQSAGMLVDIVRSGLSAEDIGTVLAVLTASVIIVSIVSIAIGAAIRSIGRSVNVGNNKIRGDMARDYVAAREGTQFTEQVYHVTGGIRKVDVVPDGPISMGIETKVGRVTLDSEIRRQVARDAKLIRSQQFDTIRWEFFGSNITGDCGPSGPLLKKLRKLGIDVVIHSDISF